MNPLEIAEITCQDLQALLAEAERGAVLPLLVDVRQPWEHEVAKLPGSVLVPLDKLAQNIELIRSHQKAASQSSQRLVFYCHHGIRSRTAAQLWQRLTGEPALSLRGGCDEWSCEIDPDCPRY